MVALILKSGVMTIAACTRTFGELLLTERLLSFIGCKTQAAAIIVALSMDNEKPFRN